MYCTVTVAFVRPCFPPSPCPLAFPLTKGAAHLDRGPDMVGLCGSDGKGGDSRLLWLLMLLLLLCVVSKMGNIGMGGI